MPVKYFHEDQELVSVWPVSNADFWKAWGYPRKGVAYDGYSKMVGVIKGKTLDRDALPVTRRIEFKKNPKLHKCDARCQGATGKICECSCGGRFHGFTPR